MICPSNIFVQQDIQKSSRGYKIDEGAINIYINNSHSQYSNLGGEIKYSLFFQIDYSTLGISGASEQTSETCVRNQPLRSSAAVLDVVVGATPPPLPVYKTHLQRTEEFQLERLPRGSQHLPTSYRMMSTGLRLYTKLS